MQNDRWDGRQRWLGDPKLVARKIRAAMALNDEHQTDIMNLISVKRQALNRRMTGVTRWHRWELATLAKHWDITLDSLTGENHTPEKESPCPPSSR